MAGLSTPTVVLVHGGFVEGAGFHRRELSEETCRACDGFPHRSADRYLRGCGQGRGGRVGAAPGMLAGDGRQRCKEHGREDHPPSSGPRCGWPVFIGDPRGIGNFPRRCPEIRHDSPCEGSALQRRSGSLPEFSGRL